MLVLMVRNESAILERCVSAARPFVDEVLVADTGSEDSTRDIARALGAKVAEDVWRQLWMESNAFAPSCEDLGRRAGMGFGDVLRPRYRR